MNDNTTITSNQKRQHLPWRRRRLLANQHRHHLLHARPPQRVRVTASQAELQHHLHLHLLILIPNPLVRRLQDLPLRIKVPHPVDQHRLLLHHVHLNRPPPARHLQHHHPKAVHVARSRRRRHSRKLRRQVPQGPDYPRRVRDLPVLVKLCEPEVAEPAAHLRVEQYVARLNVSVDNHLVPAMVEVIQALSHVGEHAPPLIPAEKLLGSVEDPAVEAPIGHVVVHEHELVPLSAPASHLDQVLVLKPSHARDLGHEFSQPLLRIVVHALDSDFGLVLEFSSVNLSEPARAQKLIIGEPISGLVKLFVGEPVRPILELPIFDVIIFFISQLGFSPVNPT
ncbi:hypothetical protein PanWU01x14_066650 [Parasponia andersonii]|uniref:Uncharacterized protein n=1 Tax=Parasponia andersonii TaxID=3476 RepID=A0A2P5DG59_PARAD|nr:hypothetical protein PanWU01x14_066650 [Parasponia andersonii]